MARRMRRGGFGVGAAGLVLLLMAGTGCSHSPAQKMTGPPEALSVAAQLKGMTDEAPAISGTFTYETTQDRSAYFAEQVFWGSPPMEFLSAVPKTSSKESAQTIALANYVEQTLKDGPPQGTRTEVRQYQQRQQGKMFYVSRLWTIDGKDYQSPITMAWNGKRGTAYQSKPKWAKSFGDRDDMMRMDGSPEPVRFFSWRMAFPTSSAAVSVRHEVVNGEELVVLREDSGDVLYREYYLAAKEGLVPRRIVQRMKLKQKMPEQDVRSTIETETGRWWNRSRTTREVVIPAAPLKLLDWNHGTWDSETTVTGYVVRPDGKWFVTQSTTVYPFFRRTETFKAENVSFSPLPGSAFEVQVPKDVAVRR